MEIYFNVLMALGLHEHGAKIYLNLLESGESSVADITKNTGLFRVEVYRQLPQLTQEGFISELPSGKRKVYKATHPKTIKQRLSEQNLSLQNSADNLIEIFSKKDTSQQLENIVFTNSSFSEIFSDIITSLENEDVFYTVSSNTKNKSKQIEKFEKDIQKKKLEQYSVLSGKHSSGLAPKNEYVIIPEELDDFDSNISLILYANKVAYIHTDIQRGYIIKDEYLSDFLKKLFRILYVSLTK